MHSMWPRQDRWVISSHDQGVGGQGHPHAAGVAGERVVNDGGVGTR